MPTTVPFLVFRSFEKFWLPLRESRLYKWRPAAVGIAVCSILCLGISGRSEAFTQVTISTSAPIGIEEAFITSTTAQYLGKVTKNPLASHTYALTIFGKNPNYNAPAPPPSNLEQALSLGATVYVYGFANGMSYQNEVSINLAGTLANLCNEPDNFILNNKSSSTFDQGTCLDSLGTLLDQFFKIEISTPTPLPPVP